MFWDAPRSSNAGKVVHFKVQEPEEEAEEEAERASPNHGPGPLPCLFPRRTFQQAAPGDLRGLCIGRLSGKGPVFGASVSEEENPTKKAEAEAEAENCADDEAPDERSEGSASGEVTPKKKKTAGSSSDEETPDGQPESCGEVYIGLQRAIEATEKYIQQSGRGPLFDKAWPAVPLHRAGQGPEAPTSVKLRTAMRPSSFALGEVCLTARGRLEQASSTGRWSEAQLEEVQRRNSEPHAHALASALVPAGWLRERAGAEIRLASQGLSGPAAARALQGPRPAAAKPDY